MNFRQRRGAFPADCDELQEARHGLQTGLMHRPRVGAKKATGLVPCRQQEAWLRQIGAGVAGSIRLAQAFQDAVRLPVRTTASS